MTLFWFWLIVAGAFAVVEMVTLAFFAVFLVLGALGAALAKLLGFGVLTQSIVFAVVGVGGIMLGRPFLMQALKRRREPVLRTGAEGMIGQVALLNDPILGISRPGHVVIAGELWPALTADGRSVPANTQVVVKSVRSTTLIVEPLSGTSNQSV